MNSDVAPAALPTRRQSFTVVLAIELWERFGFYGMQAILLLYMVEHLGLHDRDANLMIGAFSALTYVYPALGGLAGDRLLGARRCMLIGAFILAGGYMVLGMAARHPSLLYGGMALISTGNALFKPNAGNLVRRIYEGDDAELDAAFTIYYMAVNVGSTVSMLLVPWLQDRYGAPVAFLTCAVGLVLGLVYYFWRARWVNHVGGGLDQSPARPHAVMIVAAGAVVAVLVALVVLRSERLASIGIWCAAAAIVLVWGLLYGQSAPEERPGLRLAYFLCAETMVYTLFYQQQLTSLTLFALRAVDGHFRIGGVTLFTMSAGQFQALDPLWIMAASPVLALLYRRLARDGVYLSLAHKITIGFGVGTLAFFIWWLTAAAAHGLVSAWVMVVGYGFASLAEVLTMGLGLAIIARYVPYRLSGFMMGSLYLLWALAMYAGSVLANIATPAEGAAAVQGPAQYVPLLRDLALALLVATALSAALLPLARKWDRQHTKFREVVQKNGGTN